MRYAKKDKNSGMLAVITIFATVLAAAILLLAAKGASALIAEATSDNSTISLASACSVGTLFMEDPLAREAREIYENNNELLTLVNKQHPLSENYSVRLTTTKSGRFELAEALYDDMVKMFAEGDKAGHGYVISSAYRSNEKQQSLIDADVDKYVTEGMSYDDALRETLRSVMPAGCSEHATGLAIDILGADCMNMDQSQASSEDNRWLQENCWRFGFILRYPENGEEVTGIIYEPWHFRYVGSDAAEFMHETGLTLEEFHELL